jgi:periplasmic divalent cation tolerance protein
MKDQGLIVIFVTAPSRESAVSLAGTIIDSQLAACVNILPEITSVYNWKGKREQSEEVLLLVKSRAELFPELETLISSNHPYEVPEILAIPSTAVAEPYARWLRDETKLKQ